MEIVDKKTQEKIYGAPFENGPYIHVDYVASKIALLYERVRQVIDYQEEHLLRENAIERILRRRLFSAQHTEPFALPLIEELIRAGYFPNDSIPESKIEEVQTILNKYIARLKNLKETKRNISDNIDFLYGIAACEIEEFIDPPIKELVLLEFEYETLRSRLNILKPEISDDKKGVLLFTAINQTLLRADKRKVYFRLMQKVRPRWFEPNDLAPSESPATIEEIKRNLDEIIEYEGLKRLRNVTRQFAIVFHIISDITGNDPSKFITLAADKELLAQEIKRVYEKRFNILKTKLRRASFRSVVSIFWSKIAIALSLEVPFELLIIKQVVAYSFLLVILLPPLLMFLIVATIRLPPKKNLEMLIAKVGSVIDGTFNFEPIELRTKKRRLFTSLTLGAVQLLILATVFWIVILILMLANLSFLSIGIFLIFLSLIIFSGMRIRQWSYELTVETRNEGIFGFVVDALSIPIVILGKTLAGKFYKFNIFILFTNLVFEAPFQSFINFVEEWRKFVKEKKEEL